MSVSDVLGDEAKNALIFGGIGLVKYDENRNIVWVSDLLHEMDINIIAKTISHNNKTITIFFSFDIFTVITLTTLNNFIIT